MSPLERLRNADDASDIEYPADRMSDGWRSLRERVIALGAAIGAERIHEAQDATFFAELRGAEWRVVISNFGDLASIQPQRPDLETAVRAAGFEPIPEGERNLRYDGKNPFFRNTTWEYRFFSYV